MLERYSEKGQFREGSVHAMRTLDVCHANMPNVRIGPGLFARPHDLLIEAVQGPRGRESRKRNFGDERRPVRDLDSRAQAADAGGAARARRGEARRKAAVDAKPMPKEFQGPKGPEPTRYGDWENKGIASDF
jgi:hypothetical protein